MTTEKTTKVNLERKRGDTWGIVFVVKNKDTGVVEDISTWSNFLLTVDPEQHPDSDVNNIFQAIGSLVTDGSDGKVRYFPPGTSPEGSYFYDAQGLDNDNKKRTIAEGRYKLTQDITKD